MRVVLTGNFVHENASIATGAEEKRAVEAKPDSRHLTASIAFVHSKTPKSAPVALRGVTRRRVELNLARGEAENTTRLVGAVNIRLNLQTSAVKVSILIHCKKCAANLILRSANILQSMQSAVRRSHASCIPTHI